MDPHTIARAASSETLELLIRHGKTPELRAAAAAEKSARAGGLRAAIEHDLSYLRTLPVERRLQVMRSWAREWRPHNAEAA